MPIYPYECINCGYEFEKIEKASGLSWKEEAELRHRCPACNEMAARKVAGMFKLGSKALETTGKSGYETDDFTMGKLIDEGGIPYEEKNRLRNREKMIKRQKDYGRKLKERSKKYSFDPFSNEE